MYIMHISVIVSAYTCVLISCDHKPCNIINLYLVLCLQIPVNFPESKVRVERGSVGTFSMHLQDAVRSSVMVVAEATAIILKPLSLASKNVVVRVYHILCIYHVYRKINVIYSYEFFRGRLI